MKGSSAQMHATGFPKSTDEERKFALAEFLAPTLASEPVQAQLEALLQRLGLHRASEGSQSVVVTGVDAGVGATTVATGLGWSLASRHRIRAVLLGADLRTSEDGASAGPGLRQVLSEFTPLDDALVQTEYEGLDVLSAGPGDSGLAGADVHRLLRELESRYPVVIVDTAPVLEFPETALVACEAQGTVLVAAHLETSRRRLSMAGNLIRSSGGRLRGAVVNRVDDPLPRWLSSRL